ncbi:MAG TPA: phosphatase PAP2 family protein [Tepidisphaeraceae bacterium]
MIGKLRNFLDEAGGLVLLAMLLVVGGTWGFIKLLGEVKEGDTQRFDDWAVQTLVQWHGPQYKMLEEVGRDITALGGIPVLVLSTLGVVGFLLMIRNYGAMWLVIVATVGGLIISSILKYLIDRPRPHFGTQLSNVYTTSFPSGHSMMSAVVYLTLGSLMANVVSQWRLKLYIIFLALLVTFLVGVSRVYMGVHWPTDVLAGWTAGLVWAILCWLLARQLRRRGAIEQVDKGSQT